MNQYPKKERRGLKAFSAMILSILQKEKEIDYTRVAEVIIGMAGNTGEDKNIRRRIYDALNVMCAIEIVKKDKKMVYLVDNPLCGCETEVNKRLIRLGHAITCTTKLKERIEEKKRVLEETVKRKDLLLKLIERNKKKEHEEEKERLHFPFLLISTGKKSRIDCETNDKRSYFKFIFASEYQIYEDVHILKQVFREHTPKGSCLTSKIKTKHKVQHAQPVRTPNTPKRVTAQNKPKSLPSSTGKHSNGQCSEKQQLKEQHSREKHSTEKYSTEKDSKEKYSKEQYSKGQHSKGQCSTEKEHQKDIPSSPGDRALSIADFSKQIIPENNQENLQQEITADQDWLQKLPLDTTQHSPLSSSYMFTEDDDWINIYNFLN